MKPDWTSALWFFRVILHSRAPSRHTFNWLPDYCIIYRWSLMNYNLWQLHRYIQHVYNLFSVSSAAHATLKDFFYLESWSQVKKKSVDMSIHPTHLVNQGILYSSMAWVWVYFDICPELTKQISWEINGTSTKWRFNSSPLLPLFPTATTHHDTCQHLISLSSTSNFHPQTHLIWIFLIISLNFNVREKASNHLSLWFRVTKSLTRKLDSF